MAVLPPVTERVINAGQDGLNLGRAQPQATIPTPTAPNVFDQFDSSTGGNIFDQFGGDGKQGKRASRCWKTSCYGWRWDK